MPRVEASWEAPKYSSYSILNVVNPLLCWQDPHRHPAIKSFKVQMFKQEDQRTVDLGTTTDTYMPLPTDEYRISTSYKIRIATIGLDDRQSSYAESDTLVASPLRFDFSSANVAMLPDGRSLRTQRLLFLII